MISCDILIINCYTNYNGIETLSIECHHPTIVWHIKI